MNTLIQKTTKHATIFLKSEPIRFTRNNVTYTVMDTFEELVCITSTEYGMETITSDELAKYL